tara:strand:- start:6607 stop:7704 length:1098 start_codon:yes stop_codon:yes gene_type:complete
MENTDQRILRTMNLLALEDDSREWLGKSATLVDTDLMSQYHYPAYKAEVTATAQDIAASGNNHISIGPGHIPRTPEEMYDEAIERVNPSWSITALTGERRLMKWAPTNPGLGFGGRHADRFIREELIGVLKEWGANAALTDQTREKLNNVLENEFVREQHGIPIHFLHSRLDGMTTEDLPPPLGTAPIKPLSEIWKTDNSMLHIAYTGHRIPEGVEKEYRRILPSFITQYGVVTDDTNYTKESIGKAEQAAREAAQNTSGHPEYQVWFDGVLIMRDWQPTLRNTVAPYSTTTTARALQHLGSTGLGQFMKGVFADQNLGPNMPAQEMTDRPFEQLWQDEMPNEVVPPPKNQTKSPPRMNQRWLPK